MVHKEMVDEFWQTEELHADFKQQIRISNHLYSGKTDFQNVEIFENSTHGKILFLDGILQTTESDESYYHEMIVHPVMFSHPNPLKVLIIGGADGGTLREVLRHPINRAVLVDIDSELIGLCRSYLSSISRGAFDDPRSTILSEDGSKFICDTDERFDVIIVDSTDPVGPGISLFQEQFFLGCQRALESGGIIVTQNGVPFYQPEELVAAQKCRQKVFLYAGFYTAPVPLYAGGYMAFGWGSDVLDPSKISTEQLKERITKAGLKFKIYTSQGHISSFTPPPRILELLAEAEG